jgi:hypothetical protein
MNPMVVDRWEVRWRSLYGLGVSPHLDLGDAMMHAIKLRNSGVERVRLVAIVRFP